MPIVWRERGRLAGGSNRPWLFRGPRPGPNNRRDLGPGKKRGRERQQVEALGILQQDLQVLWAHTTEARGTAPARIAERRRDSGRRQARQLCRLEGQRTCWQGPGGAAFGVGQGRESGVIARGEVRRR